MPNITRANVEDAMMQGEEKIKKWMGEADQAYEGPMVDTMIAMAWARMPQGARDYYKKQMPAVYAEMEKRFGGKKQNGTT